MAEGTILQTMAGAVLSVSATLPATYDAAGYAATTITYTAVGEIEDHGSHGGTANIPTFTSVDDGIVQKFKGSKNYGTKQLVIGNIESDAGQDLLATAFESQNRYSVKITYPLRQGESTAAVHYLDALVSSFQFTDGASDAIRKVNVGLEICRAPVRVAAT
jgi:hypothetical protein